MIFFACVALHAAGTWSVPLLDRDEPRFAEASREMRECREYVVPYFNDRYRFDKPPLIYWLQIASYHFFGENEFAARLPSAIAAALIAVLLFAWGRQLGGERLGWWAAIIFTLCFQTFIHAKAAVADMWLVFFVAGAHWAGYQLLADSLGQNASEAGKRKYWRIIFYITLALAFLTKGPIGWLPLLTVASTKFFLHDVSLSRRFWFATGLAGTLALVLLWGAPALIRTNGEFFRVGIGRHVIERSFGSLEGHGANSWSAYLATLPFYFVTVFIGFFPWSIKLPALVKRLWRERDPLDKYLINGSLLYFIIMTFVKTKLPHYTLPAFPLMSLLLARHLPALRATQFARRAAVAAALISLSAALFLFPILARTFPSTQLFEKARNDISPQMDFAAVDYLEPSLVWCFRSRTHGFFRSIGADQVTQFMQMPGPHFVVLPSPIARQIYPELPAGWKSYRADGFTLAKGKRSDLTLILKPVS